MSLAPKPGWGLEHTLFEQGYSNTAGIDEAGRGALAGPVVAAVVVLPYGAYPYDDSKKLRAAVREGLEQDIKARALMWAVGSASPEEIDALNILQATHLAAHRALSALPRRPTALVTDYLKLALPEPVVCPPKADSISVQVAAASILAKTQRDRLMCALDEAYPHYGFAAHKGYGAPSHLRALGQVGVSDVHRKTFAPVRRLL